ncbi:MAG: LptA/OstA family protein, partial [Candidatus Omnitrophota bacterium]|nr:LptA/OstA family protein [Candidatus Omnitrophota bacterium]
MVLFWILCFGICHYAYAQENTDVSAESDTGLNKETPAAETLAAETAAVETPVAGDKEKSAQKPLVINADQLEYSADNKTATATGNVEVDYKGAKLTCQKLTVNTETKEGVAEGNARLDDAQGVIEGVKISYNFESKVGTIMDAHFRSNPYFGEGARINKISGEEFRIFKGYLTTCNLDRPHYRFGARRVNFFPDDRVQIKGATIYADKAPLFYIPEYNHSMNDPLMHVQFQPGSSKEWGPYLLSLWRVDVSKYVQGRIFLDYRGN